jgi:ribosomal protein S18 acetylase RimI-like enzyme
VTNQAAINLYNGVLKYDIRSLDKGYYADGEDAHDMCVFFNKPEDGEESKDTAEESKVVGGDGGVDNFAESNANKDRP